MNQNSYVHKDGKNNGKRNTLPRMFSWLWKSGTINVWPFSFFNGTYWNIKITKSKNVKIGNYISIYCYSIHCQQKSQGSKQYNNKLLNKYDTKVCENNNPFPPTHPCSPHAHIHAPIPHIAFVQTISSIQRTEILQIISIKKNQLHKWQKQKLACCICLPFEYKVNAHQWKNCKTVTIGVPAFGTSHQKM